MTRPFTLSPRVREFLRTGISGYVLVLPANEPVPDGLNYGLGLITRVEHDNRLPDGRFWVIPERAFDVMTRRKPRIPAPSLRAGR